MEPGNLVSGTAASALEAREQAPRFGPRRRLDSTFGGIERSKSGVSGNAERSTLNVERTHP